MTHGGTGNRKSEVEDAMCEQRLHMRYKEQHHRSCCRGAIHRYPMSIAVSVVESIMAARCHWVSQRDCRTQQGSGSDRRGQQASILMQTGNKGRQQQMAASSSAFQIPYTSQDFPAGAVAGRAELKADWSDLLWSALTVGRPNTAYVLGHGDASYHEALFRLSLVRMALEERPFCAGLYRTEAFRALDPTEKGAVSYFLGWPFASSSRTGCFVQRGFSISTFSGNSWIPSFWEAGRDRIWWGRSKPGVARLRV